MVEDVEDPREVPWHPRFASAVVGHDAAAERFLTAFIAGRPHHAWLLQGQEGIGKATLAYNLAVKVLASTSNATQAQRWVTARAHPDLIVLERSFNDSKPKKLRSEITIDDARHFIEFFNRTSGSDGWRVGLVDCADQLNNEAANALLKLVEEPPNKCLILLVCHNSGKLLRTLKSRCTKLPLNNLSEAETVKILQALPLATPLAAEKISMLARLSKGSPGQALQLVNSGGAQAFDEFQRSGRVTGIDRVSISTRFSSRVAAVQDYDIFMALLLDWLATRARDEVPSSRAKSLASLHAKLTSNAAVTAGYNLDRKVAIMEALALLEDALKTA